MGAATSSPRGVKGTKPDDVGDTGELSEAYPGEFLVLKKILWLFISLDTFVYMKCVLDDVSDDGDAFTSALGSLELEWLTTADIAHLKQSIVALRIFIMRILLKLVSFI